MKGTTKNRRKKKKNESEQLRITEAGQLLAALGPLCDVVGPFKRSHRRRFDAKTAAIATKKISSVTPYVISFSFDALLESNQFPFYRIFKRFNNGRGIKIISNTHHKKKKKIKELVRGITWMPVWIWNCGVCSENLAIKIWMIKVHLTKTLVSLFYDRCTRSTENFHLILVQNKLSSRRLVAFRQQFSNSWGP